MPEDGQPRNRRRHNPQGDRLFNFHSVYDDSVAQPWDLLPDRLSDRSNPPILHLYAVGLRVSGAVAKLVFNCR